MGTVLLIGCGEMARFHHDAMRGVGAEPVVIGRRSESAARFEAATGTRVASLDLSVFLASGQVLPSHAVVSVSVEQLASVSIALMQSGVRQILVEKPGALYHHELAQMLAVASETSSEVHVAYNRRFYTSVRQARQLIAEDGGVLSCHCDFTEWAHQVEALDRSPEQKARWVLANSTHMLDLAFFFAGTPVDLHSAVSGGLPWHPSSSVFNGSGVTDRGVLLSYHANWSGPGRWLLEVVTRKRKLIFQPVEQLRLMSHGSVAVSILDPIDDLDARFKPGVYAQLRSFLSGDSADLCRLEEQAHRWSLLERIAGY